MKTCKKIMAWLIALSTIMPGAVSVSAEENLRSWDFASDWVELGNPLGEAWNDTYDNVNVWGVHGYTGEYEGVSSELTPTCVNRDDASLKAWYWGDYSEDLELLGSNGMIRALNSGSYIYSRVMNGYNHAYTWTAPDSMTADIEIAGTRQSNPGRTYFDLYQNGIKVRQLFTVYNPTENSSNTLRLSLKKGDRITLAVHGTNADGSTLKTEYSLDKFKISEINANIESLASWDYRKDAIVANDASGVYGDTYGNDNTWGIYFGKTIDGAYKMKPGSYLRDSGVYALTDPDNAVASLQQGSRIYFSNPETINLTGTSYAEIASGTDLYFVFRAPKDMYARFNLTVNNRWGRSNVTYLDLYTDDGTVINSKTLGANEGALVQTESLVKMNQGETITLKVDNKGQITTAVNVYIDVQECYLEYNPVNDYTSSGSPLANTWKTFDKETDWTLNYTTEDGQTYIPTAESAGSFKVSETGDTFLPGTHFGAADFTDTTWSYIQLSGTPITRNLKWTAPKDGMISITCKGSTRWGNGYDDSDGVHHPMHVGFGIEKNENRVAYFESAGSILQNVGSVTKKIAVKAGDVINFTVASVKMANGKCTPEDLVVYNDIKYVGEASGELKFNTPEITKADDGTVTATITGTNETGEKAQAVLILAEYTGSTLTQVKFEELSDYNAEFSKTVSMTGTSANSSYKVFAWNSFGSMKPIK